ncbi:hypothetical protein ACTXG6_08825 [Pseudonocardia sp. Cha107L01]|uniref:hypothetical protein n=1 Tax=Pseudonocardia sp. Cha107L01 TaxID=3457576 RepID=UPI00403EDB8E
MSRRSLMDIIVQLTDARSYEQRPEQAREARAAIKKICDDERTDIKTILGILRDDTSTAERLAQPRAPRGGLGRLTELLDTAEAGGVRVEPLRRSFWRSRLPRRRR